MSDKSFLERIRDAVVGPPPPKVGERLTPEMRESFQRVDEQATLLHDLARRLQTPERRDWRE